MRGIPGSVWGRVCSAVLASTLIAGPALQAAPAFASEEVVASTEQSSAPTPQTASSDESSPTIVRELVDKRGENVTQWLLSDGTIKAEITEVPTRFEAESGQLVDIDPSLVPAPESGAVQTAATSVTVTFDAQEAGEAPVTLEGTGFSVGLNMLGVAENARLVFDDTTRYLNVAPDADLEYQAVRDGVKETVILKSAQAPSTYRFSMALDGLEVRRNPMGGYALYRDGEGTAALELGSLVVFDSSEDAAGEPAYCPETTMTVEATGDGAAVVTYEVSPEWLSDPARVFPVMVDPTITGASATADTYYTSAYPSNSYGTSDELKVGYYDSSTGHNRSYVKFSWDTNTIPVNAYVSRATFEAFCFHQYYTNSTTDVRIGRVTSAWGGNWNNKPTYTFLDTTNVTGRSDWAVLEVGPTVQDWVEGEANYGFQLYQLNPEDNTHHWKKFRSSDYSDSSKLPKLVVTYSDPRLSTLAEVDKTVYRTGDTVEARVRVVTTIPEDVNCIKAYVNWDDTTDVRRRGTFQWTETQPTTGWDSELCPGDGGGYVSSYPGSAGSDKVELLSSECSETVLDTNDYAEVIFRWKLKDTYGDIQDNDIDVQVMMDPTDGNNSGNRWNSAKLKIDSNFDVITDGAPVAVATATATEQSAQASFSPQGSSDDLGIVLYEWDFDDDGTWDRQTTTPTTQLFTYDNGGSRSYRLRVTDAYGHANTVTQSVLVRPGVLLLTPTTEVTSVVPTVTWEYHSTTPQTAYEVEVATSAAGPAIASTGVIHSSSRETTPPVPPDGWRVRGTYFVRVRVASAGVGGAGLLWSGWNEPPAFTLSHQPVSAAEREKGLAVLVFITGWRNTQGEYEGDDYSGLRTYDEDWQEDEYFSSIITALEGRNEIVKVPSQYNKGHRNDLPETYRDRVMYNKATVYGNGNRIYNYLRANKKITSGDPQIEGGTTPYVEPYIIVAYSKGGLDARAFLDRACKNRKWGSAYRDACLGVIQIGSPNLGSPQADVQWNLNLTAAYAAVHEIGDTHSEAMDKAIKAAKKMDWGIWDLRQEQWYRPGADNDYNNHLGNKGWIASEWFLAFTGPLPYHRFYGNAVARVGVIDAWANTDGVVPIASAKGRSFLTGEENVLGANGGTEELQYGVHNGSRNMAAWAILASYITPQSIMCEPSSVLFTQPEKKADFLTRITNRIKYFDGDWWLYENRDGAPLAASVASAASVAPIASTPSLQSISHEQLDPGEETTKTIHMSPHSPVVVDGLPEGSELSVLDAGGEAVPVMVSDEVSEPDEDSADAGIGYVVTVEETGTYLFSMESPDIAAAGLYEIGGPTLHVESPGYLSSTDSGVIKAHVSDEEGQATGTDWEFTVLCGDSAVPANDFGIYPDEVAGDGVAAALLPPVGVGEQLVSVEAERRNDGHARTGLCVVTGVDQDSIVIDGTPSIEASTSGELITSRNVRVPLSNNTDAPVAVEIQCDLRLEEAAEAVEFSTVATLAPGVPQDGIVNVYADQLARFGDGTVRIDAVRVLPYDSTGELTEPAASDCPLDEVTLTGIQFQNDRATLQHRLCTAGVVGGDEPCGEAFSLRGLAGQGGGFIEGVEYTCDGGASWFEASSADGTWDEPYEEFVIDASVSESGCVVFDIRPVSGGGERWDGGALVPVTVSR